MKVGLLLISVVTVVSLLLSSQVAPTYTATHYGESFSGNTMGCGGVYEPTDPTIIAIDPSLYSAFPCGTSLIVVAPTGRYIIAKRVDSCPGCKKNQIDLSEAGIATLCGYPCDIIEGLKIERYP